MKRVWDLLCVVLAMVCLMTVCVLDIFSIPKIGPVPQETIPVYSPNTPSSPNTIEGNDLIFKASENNYEGSGLSFLTDTREYDGVKVYCAAPVFPTKEAADYWENLVSSRLSELLKEKKSIKEDFVLEKVRDYYCLTALFDFSEKDGWQNASDLHCYWNPKNNIFVDFHSFFDGFSEYKTYFADFLTEQSQSASLKDLVDGEKLKTFLGGEMSFAHFSIEDDGITVNLDETNFLKAGCTAALFVPDYYFDGRIVEKISNKWMEYNPAKPGEKVIAITFDDGPSPSTTPIVLEALEKYHAKATFFTVGHRINKNTVPLLQKAVAIGSQLANHSFNHANFNLLDIDGIMQEINSTQELIYNATGIYPTCLRPPYGNLKKDLVAETGMHAILWNVDTLDWKEKNTELLIQHVLNETKSGDIVLMHDIHQTTVDAVEAIIVGLQEQGYRLVTVEELFDLRNKEPDGSKYFSQRSVS